MCPIQAYWGVLWMSSISSSLEDRLKVHFNKVMKCDNIPLLSNFDVYKESLPVRQHGGTGEHLPLYKLLHWTRDNDMKSLADQLERPPIHRATVKYLTAPGGSGKTTCILRILLHLDEHRKMCQWEVDNLGDEAIKWAMFRRGAMEALVNVPKVTVVATYTARPPLPAQASSAVCRDPVAMPCLDVDAAMQEIEELQFPHSQDSFNGEQKQLWATLRFRLGMKLTECGLTNFHKHGNVNADQLLQKFKSEASHTDTTEALEKCIQLCTIQVGR